MNLHELQQHELDAFQEILDDPAVLDGATLGFPNVTQFLGKQLLETGQVLIFDKGAFLICPVDKGVLEVHTMIRPAGRGKEAVAASNECMAWCFLDGKAVTVTTQIHDDLPHVALFAKWAGFTPFRQEGDFTFYVVSCLGWVMRSIPLETSGVELALRLGIELDKARPRIHARFLGFLVKATEKGFHDKGISFYNSSGVIFNFPPLPPKALDRDALEVLAGEMRNPERD